MIDRFSQFPKALAERCRSAHFGDIPMLLAHPDWETAVPTVLWLHGRTANKELDPGRYLRWVRAGFAACAIDLPGHGERFVQDLQEPAATPRVVAQAVGEVDVVIEHLTDRRWGDVFDLDRLGIGGMSAGGMVALRRVCDTHPFRCVSVEGTTGWLEGLYFGEDAAKRWQRHDAASIQAIDPSGHLQGFRPIPLLALHSEADQVIPWQGQETFLKRLRARYSDQGAAPAMIESRTWTSTGAPQEHIGFGKVSNDAKNIQTEFFARHLGASAPEQDF